MLLILLLLAYELVLGFGRPAREVRVTKVLPERHQKRAIGPMIEPIAMQVYDLIVSLTGATKYYDSEELLLPEETYEKYCDVLDAMTGQGNWPEGREAFRTALLIHVELHSSWFDEELAGILLRTQTEYFYYLGQTRTYLHNALGAERVTDILTTNYARKVAQRLEASRWREVAPDRVRQVMTRFLGRPATPRLLFVTLRTSQFLTNQWLEWLKNEQKKVQEENDRADDEVEHYHHSWSVLISTQFSLGTLVKQREITEIDLDYEMMLTERIQTQRFLLNLETGVAETIILKKEMDGAFTTAMAYNQARLAERKKREATEDSKWKKLSNPDPDPAKLNEYD